MKSKAPTMSCLILGVVLLFPGMASPQGKPDANAAPTGRIVEDCPEEAGVLIQTPEWTAIPSEVPSRTHAKRGWASALSYGAIPASVVSEYAGAHASVQVAPRKVVICIAGYGSLPDAPALVKLHAKKDAREFNGGKLRPFRGKLSEAQQHDLVSIDISHPDDEVWLVQSTDALPPGEYAVMVGKQNVSIYPFTVTDKQGTSSAPQKQ